jgi:L-ascorbate metabolism protein UlaG (beta-lactamase superfamily)
VSAKNPGVAITRIVNACVLLEFGDEAVLTDPYFRGHWFMRFREPIGLVVEQLPKLTAILGGHGVFDHWQPSSMHAYPFKAEAKVYVATRGMMTAARSAGFGDVEVLEWGAQRQLSASLGVEVTPRQTVTGMRVNNYVLTAGALRVFVGTEARDLEPLREYRRTRPPAHVVVAPIDGSSLLGHKLVMGPREAIAAAQILGARVLVPIHYANRSIPLLMQTPGTIDELLRLAKSARDLEVVRLAPGERWHCPYDPGHE